ncbi:MAG: urea ABC transporter permease subunit UrtB, partial [Rhodocyclaceae bacterium]
MKPLFLALLLWLFTLPAFAALDRAVVKQLADEDSDLKIAAIQKLTRSADPEALGILQAMVDGTLQSAEGETITINNRVRREIDGALAALKLFHPDRNTRLTAAKDLTTSLAGDADPGMAPMLVRARDQESDDKVKAAIAQAYALATLKHADVAVRLAAVKALAGSGDPNIKLLLLAMMDPAKESEVSVRRAAIAAHAEVKSRLALGETVGRIFSGLSLGSILLLAALGLAITYGVMGVINMAHGELLMV